LVVKLALGYMAMHKGTINAAALVNMTMQAHAAIGVAYMIVTHGRAAVSPWRWGAVGDFIKIVTK
jgi:hypothetical protein